MKLVNILLIILLISCHTFAQRYDDVMQSIVIPVFMSTAGLSLMGIWTMDLVKGDKVEKRDGLLGFRDKTTGQVLLPHLVAEYSTGVCLLTGAYGLHTDKPWGKDIAMLGLGALVYTSTNSLSWVLTEKERYVYGIPMVITLIGSGISLTFLL
ncbi:MAG: hypothetical protein JXR87_02830 [Candidatus Marinimicrobia bacterium]|nr:hypothetical protein [Candidatus Neomarinimicrobiota bacterium]